MPNAIKTPDFPLDLNSPGFLTNQDVLLVECAEIWDERFGNPELQARYAFGLTHLGGLTVGLGRSKVEQIVKFNYQIEEQNTVGLCLPYNLVITPRKFFLNIFTNNFSQETQKYIDDILEANEKHQKRGTIFFDFIYVNGILDDQGNMVQSWSGQEIKDLSLRNLERYILGKELRYTQAIYFVC